VEHGNGVLDESEREWVLHKATIQKMKNPSSEVPWFVGFG